jgi:hypothetical protein
MNNAPVPLVAIGDLHGHLDLFERLLAHIDREVPEARIVTLGDYVDNGPQIPALLDRLIALQAARPGRFCPILGNHDLALLRALGWPHADPDPAWYARLASRYWNPGLGTPQAYGARDAPSFARRFPETHRRFLAALPWYHDDGEHFCVHASLEMGPIAPRCAALAARTLPAEPTFMPAPCAISAWRSRMIQRGIGCGEQPHASAGTAVLFRTPAGLRLGHRRSPRRAGRGPAPRTARLVDRRGAGDRDRLTPGPT